MFDRVLVGADNSPTAKRAIEEAARFTLMSGGTLHLVTTFTATQVSDSSLPAEYSHATNEGEAEANLQVLSFIAKNLGVKPVLHLAKGDPADVIIETADKIKADLIVMTSHRPAMRTYFLGSNAGHVVRYAKCSVLVVRH